MNDLSQIGEGLVKYSHDTLFKCVSKTNIVCLMGSILGQIHILRFNYLFGSNHDYIVIY